MTEKSPGLSELRSSCVAVTPSKAIVASMMAANPNIRRIGFAATMRELFEWPEIGEIARTVIPDAFHVSQERREVTIIEVDDTHPIDALKASKIGDLADALLEEEWDLVVIVVDYAGTVRAAVPGWAFLPQYTSKYAPPGCRDFTPAAVAASRAVADRL